MWEALQTVFMGLGVLLLAGLLFIQILIWRAMTGRTLTNARLVAEIASFSNKLAGFSREIGKIEGPLGKLERRFELFSEDIKKLPEALRRELEKYAKSQGNGKP